MLKIHVYTKDHAHTIKGQELELSILRSHSVKDGEYVRPKGHQMVMLKIREENGQLFITNQSTGLEVEV